MKSLSKLAEIDPVTAKQLQQVSTTDCIADILFDVAPAERKVSAWLRSNDEVPDVLIVPGIGNGAEIEALLVTLPQDSKILLIERSISRAFKLFEQFDVFQHVEAGRLTFALGEDEMHIDSQLMTMLDLAHAQKIRFFDFDDDTESAQFYGSILENIRSRMRLKLFNMSTLVHLGPTWQFNTIKNLPRLVSNPGVELLEDVFSGKPALIIAAGPSLNDALEELRELCGKFVVIAVGTALKPLRKAGIRPDLVVSVDASWKTDAQFKTKCDDLYLACSSLAFCPVLEKFKGLFSGHINVNPAGEWISSLSAPKGKILGGGTVTATAIDIAFKMKCNPILTVGLDLSMQEDGTSHALDTMYHKRRLDTEHKDILSVPGNNGETVITTSQFSTYIDIISHYTKLRSDVTFVNVNSGGALIDGMECRQIDDIKDFAGSSFNAYDILSELHEAFVFEDVDQVCSKLEEVAGKIEDVMASATSAAMTCNQLIMMLNMPGAGSKESAMEKLTYLEECDKVIMDARESSDLLDMSLRPIYYTLGTPPEEHEAIYSDAVLANMRSRRLYEQIAGAAKWTRNLIFEQKKILEEDSTAWTLHADNDREIA